jgi:hypothetical protein
MSSTEKNHTHKTTKRHISKKVIGIGIAMIIVMLLAGLSAYAITQTNNQLNSTKKELSSSESAQVTLEKANKDLKIKNQTNEAQIESLKRSLAELTDTKISLPALTISDTKRFNGTPNQYNNGAIIIDGINDFLMVKVQVANNSKKDSYFSVADLKLKNTNNESYPYYTVASVTGWSGPLFASGAGFFPAGYTPITSQTVKPGEKLSGGLIFVAPTSVKNFKLFYGDSIFDINL